jgi:uncharacterized membrane protein YdjX (TVP38/TMEM64 family)
MTQRQIARGGRAHENEALGQGTAVTPARSRRGPRLTAAARLTLTWGAIVGGVLAVYFVALRNGDIRTVFSAATSLGPVGMVAGVVIMAVFSILPVPSEFVSILLMHTYGVWVGMVLSWIGGIAGAVSGLWLARSFFRPTAERMGAKYLRLVEPWLRERGTAGLLAVRFIPLVPYHFVNYLAGVLSVPVWPFLATTAAGTLPFQVGLAGVYSGVAYGSLADLAAGGGFLVALVLVGAWQRRRVMAAVNSLRAPDELGNDA